MKWFRVVEAKAPLVLPRDVRARLAAIVKLNVIVNAAFMNKCTWERLSIVGTVPLALLNILVPSDQVISRKRLEKLGREMQWRR